MAEQQIVLFKIGENEFGVPVEKVQEIIKPPAITGLPNTPGFVKGVINLRNRVIPIVDLGEKLGLGRFDSEDSRIIVVELLGKTVGLTVDSVTEVLKLEEGKIEKETERFGEKKPMLNGIAKLDHRLILLLNLDELIGTGGDDGVRSAVPAEKAKELERRAAAEAKGKA